MRIFSAGSSHAPALGYTLIELLVVLAILAGIFSIVPPLFSSTASRTELHASARQMTATLRHARSLAVVQRRPVSFVVDLDHRSYQVEGRNAIRLPPLIDITLITGDTELRGSGRAAIRFFADGSSTGGRITLVSGNSVQQLDVAWLTGRVESEVPSLPNDQEVP